MRPPALPLWCSALLALAAAGCASGNARDPEPAAGPRTPVEHARFFLDRAAREIVRGSRNEDTCAWLAAILAGEADIARAKEAFAFVTSPDTKARVLAALGTAHAKAGDRDAARGSFDAARWNVAAMPRTEGDWTRDSAYAHAHIARTEAEAGYFDDIRGWVPLLDDPRLRARAWTEAVWPITADCHHARVDEIGQRQRKE